MFDTWESKRLDALLEVYWLNINKKIEEMVKACAVCQEYQTQQVKEPLIPHDIPTKPWTKIGMDLFELKGDDYLLMTDYTSRFPIVHKLKSTTSSAVTSIVSNVFGLLGPPAEIVSDNGPQFAGAPFKEMCAMWGIRHSTSSPRYPRSNGLAERMVRTIKNTIKKCLQTKQDLNMALLNIRATPVQPDLPSPAEVLFGRRICTFLPHHSTETMRSTNIHEKTQQSKIKMKENHDRRHGCQDLNPLYPGQKVRVLDHESRTWQPATVVGPAGGPRSYDVHTPNGSTIRRNRSQVREIPMGTPRRVRFEEPEMEPVEEPLVEPVESSGATPAEPLVTKESSTKTGSESTEQTPSVRRSSRVSKAPKYLAEYKTK